MSDSRKDLPSVNATNFLSRVRETLQGYLGTNGNVLDRGVTVRDLTDAGIVRVNPTYLSGGAGSPIVGAGPAVGAGGGTTTIVVPGGGSTTPPYVPDLTKPPAPTGFFAGAGLTNLQGGITAPAYTAGHGHDRSIVYGATYGGSGPLPTFGDAVELTRFIGSIFAYPSTTATTWHLWVTHLSKDGVESHPTDGLNGLSVSTGQDIPLILAALSGQIGYTELSEDFTTAFATVATVAGEAQGTANAAQGTANAAQDAATWLGNRYTVRTTVSVDGKTLVGGFGLAGTNSATQGASIDFGVSADRFWIGAPQQAGVTAVPSVKPFIVQTTDTVVNGVTVPKGVYMDAAYIVNLEAAVARLGTAWIGTAMIADASIVDAKIASLNAEKITAGLLSAERIDGRSLTIKNASGDVMLDASGDAVPPWVVQVTNTGDSGSVALAAAADSSNRARIRSLLVDGVHLKAAPSASGKSIVLSTKTTEVWSVTYGGSASLEGGDFRELDGTRFAMQPNTFYRFELSPLFMCPSDNITLGFHCVPPADASGFIAGGAQFSHGSAMVLLANLAVTPALPPPPVSPTVVLHVKSGASGGIMRFYANASVDTAVGEWSRFRAFHLREVITPASAFTRAGTEVDFRTGVISATPGLSIQPAGQTTEFYWNIGASRNSNKWHDLVYFAPPTIVYDPARGTCVMETAVLSIVQTGNDNYASIIDSPMFGSSALVQGLYSAYNGIQRYTPGSHGSCLRLDMLSISSAAEVPRWGFNRRVALMYFPGDPTLWGDFAISSSFERIQLTAPARATDYDTLYPSTGLYSMEYPEERYASIYLGPRNDPKPRTSYIEYEYFFDYMGEQITPKKRFRVTATLN